MKHEKKKIVGWREWVGLPDLHIEAINAKIDTGARTSAIHAEEIIIFEKHGKEYVRFTIFPLQRTKRGQVESVAEFVGYRMVKSSSGHISRRPVIRTNLMMGNIKYPIEITLINRDVMGFRMLIGRLALRQRFLVDPSRSYISEKLTLKKKSRDE